MNQKSPGIFTSSPPASRYVLIAPVRDEAKYLQQTIDAIVAQSVHPTRLILVDDGSSDGTREIANRAAERHHWITVVHRSNRGRRSVGPGVIEAFYDGYQNLECSDYDYLGKIDGDVTFGQSYFEHLISLFRANEKLGLASGKVYLPIGTKLVAERMRDEHVAGQVRFYRRRCFEQIGGLHREVNWDVIDEYRARMDGWVTRSFRDPELRITHHRLMGSSQHSVFHGRLRAGRGQYYVGTHPLYIIAVGVYRMWERPFIVGGICIMLGYVFALLRRQPRYDDPTFRQHLRKEQLKRLWFQPFSR